jgi:hypothetical protein
MLVCSVARCRRSITSQRFTSDLTGSKSRSSVNEPWTLSLRALRNVCGCIRYIRRGKAGLCDVETQGCESAEFPRFWWPPDIQTVYMDTLSYEQSLVLDPIRWTVLMCKTWDMGSLGTSLLPLATL